MGGLSPHYVPPLIEKKLKQVVKDEHGFISFSACQLKCYKLFYSNNYSKLLIEGGNSLIESFFR